jgi:hypothetical protein
MNTSDMLVRQRPLLLCEPYRRLCAGSKGKVANSQAAHRVESLKIDPTQSFGTAAIQTGDEAAVTTAMRQERTLGPVRMLYVRG